LSQILTTIAIWAVPVLFAITLHEAAHGWVADKLGDATARNLGRISMNPLKHIDPMGTVVIPLMMILTFGIALGAAKPVPVNPRNFKQPHLDMALVAIAGPASNFLMALFWGCLIAISVHVIPDAPVARILYAVGQAGVAINLILIALNVLPIPPLDGSKIVAGVLPPRLLKGYLQFERYGFLLLIGLVAVEIIFRIPIFSGLLFLLVKPFMFVLESLFKFQGMYF
jgi:Zn-dependent protease